MMKELDKLRQLLHTVMETLSKMATQLPDEFINSPELSDLESRISSVTLTRFKRN